MFGGTYPTRYANDQSMQATSGWACLYYAKYASGTGCKAKLNREVLFISCTTYIYMLAQIFDSLKNYNQSLYIYVFVFVFVTCKLISSICERMKSSCGCHVPNSRNSHPHTQPGFSQFPCLQYAIYRDQRLESYTFGTIIYILRFDTAGDQSDNHDTWLNFACVCLSVNVSSSSHY